MALAADAQVPRRALRTRNRRGEGGHLRADILAAATDLLDHGDERAVTLRAVARQAGIAAPSIYPHFPGRPAIMLAVVREAFAELSGRLRAAVDAAGDDAEQCLYAACHAYLDFAAAHPERYRAMFGELAKPATTGDRAAGSGPASLGAEALRVLSGALADCVTAGRSASTDPCADAVALWIGLHGLAHQRTVSHAFPWPADLVRHFAASLSRLGPA
ncbi:TetR/AcrR family transcriptional regulator [Streptomyces sp. NPDC059943]|uniref:TetR/AcrR family transcriptional regulator n=1 Tax=Streptomyces sp. NPDC059943 TaxID=3347010 RepID=UPI003647C16D